MMNRRNVNSQNFQTRQNGSRWNGRRWNGTNHRQNGSRLNGSRRNGSDSSKILGQISPSKQCKPRIYTVCHSFHIYFHIVQILEQLDNVFVKHFAPNHMLAHKDTRGNIKILWNLSRSWSGHLHIQHKLYAWYHDHSSSGSPVIFFTRLLYYTKCQVRKGR